MTVIAISEFEPAPGQEDAWDSYFENDLANELSAEANMMPGVEKRVIREHRRVIDVWCCEDDVLQREVVHITGREGNSSDEEWEMYSGWVSGLMKHSRITRFSLTGDMSLNSTAIMWKAAQTWGFAQPGIMRELQPPWILAMTHSGEAVVCLSTTANWAANVVEAQVGKPLSYTVHASFGEKLVAVTEPFEYTLEAIFGGPKGRAIALRPSHDPSALFISFRGVRPIKTAGMRVDCLAMINSKLVGKGKPPSASAWLPEGRAHSGTLDHQRSLYKALLAYISQDDVRRGNGRIVLIGISLGGALAQMSALRLALDLPELTGRLHVLAFGATTWADRTLSDRFAFTFGPRAVNLVTFEGLEGAAECMAEAEARWMLTRDAGEAAGSLIKMDPMAVSFGNELVTTHNVYAHPVLEDEGSAVCGDGVPEDAFALLNGVGGIRTLRSLTMKRDAAGSGSAGSGTASPSEGVSRRNTSDSATERETVAAAGVVAGTVASFIESGFSTKVEYEAWRATQEPSQGPPAEEVVGPPVEQAGGSADVGGAAKVVVGLNALVLHDGASSNGSTAGPTGGQSELGSSSAADSRLDQVGGSADINAALANREATVAPDVFASYWKRVMEMDLLPGQVAPPALLPSASIVCLKPAPVGRWVGCITPSPVHPERTALDPQPALSRPSLRPLSTHLPSTRSSGQASMEDFKNSNSMASASGADVAPFADDVAKLHTGKSYRSMTISEHLKLRLLSRVMATPASGANGESNAWDAERLPFMMRPESMELWEDLLKAKGEKLQDVARWELLEGSRQQDDPSVSMT